MPYNAYTPYTSSNAEADYTAQGFDYGGNNEYFRALRNYLTKLNSGATANLDFQNQLTQYGNSALAQYLDATNPASQAAELRGLQSGVMDTSAQAARQAALFNKSQGFGDGFNAGNSAAIFGQGAAQQNDLARQYASPAHQAQLAQGVMGVVNGYQNPQLQNISTISQLLAGWQGQKDQAAAQRAASSPWATVGNIAGQAAGGYASKLGGR